MLYRLWQLPLPLVVAGALLLAGVPLLGYIRHYSIEVTPIVLLAETIGRTFLAPWRVQTQKHDGPRLASQLLGWNLAIGHLGALDAVSWH